MNTVEKVELESPYGESDTCSKITIDTTGTPFVLGGVTTAGVTYTLSFWAKTSIEKVVNVNGTPQAVPVTMRVLGAEIEVTNEWVKQTVTFEATGTDIGIYFNDSGVYWLYHTQLEIGTKATDWVEAPEDTQEGTDQAITEVKNSTSSMIKQLRDSITLEVADGATGGMAQIKLKVDDVTQTGTIDLTGAVSFSDLSTAGKTTINGGNITTGTISAGRLNVEDIFAKDITATGDIQFSNKKYQIISDSASASILINSYNGLSLKGVPIYIISEGGYINMSAADGVYINSCPLISARNDFITEDNEFNFIPSGYNDHVWLNYRSGSNPTIGSNVTAYYLGRGNSASNTADLHCKDLYLNTDTKMADYVIESGVSGNWRYRKWSSGAVELWRRSAIITCSVSTAWGSLYTVQGGGTYYAGPYDLPFTVTGPKWSATPVKSDGDFWVAIAGAYDGATQSPAWRPMRPTSASSMTWAVDLYCYATLA